MKRGLIAAADAETGHVPDGRADSPLAGRGGSAFRWLWIGVALVLYPCGLPAAILVPASPLGIELAAPSVSLPARYLLESDPDHAALAVVISTRITRDRFCPDGNLLLPCPAVETSVRYTATLMLDGRAVVSGQKIVAYAVAGDANDEVEETVLLDPPGILRDDVEYSLAILLEHIDDPVAGTYRKDQGKTFGPYRLAHFSGALNFGRVETTLDGLAGNPLFLGGGRWSLRILHGESSQGVGFSHSLDVPPPVTAVRDPDGGLRATAGAVEVLGPVAFEWEGWVGQRGKTRLTPEGFIADSITLQLPPGVGWRRANERRLRSTLTLDGAGIPLDESLHPVGSASGVTTLDMQFFSETYPVEFSAKAWSWRRGVFSLLKPSKRFVRRTLYSDWKDATGHVPDSNDGYWMLLDPKAGTDLEVRPGLDGGIAATLLLGQGGFQSHFPRAAVDTEAGGELRILNNRVVSLESQLTSARARVFYGKGCRDAGAPGAIPEPLQGLEISEVTLQFTPSAGLWAEGTLTTSQEDPAVERHLEMGRNEAVPTHRTDPFGVAHFYMPGPWVPHNDGFDSPGDPGVGIDEPGEDPSAFNPARYLLSGVRATNGFALELPATQAYDEGSGDYAGANFRSFDGLQARSHIGGADVPAYPLASRSKYYARLSGVSGIHQSASGPTELPAYGYDIDLTHFGLSLLSNEPQDSRIAGSIHLPYPSGLTQGFERLLMTCCGNLSEGQITPGDDQKQLAYWSSTRTAMRSLRFTHDPNEPCDTSNALLELGVTADVAHVSAALDGFLYPRANGTLVATDTLGRESHLAMPALVNLAGYSFSAVRRSYFNDYDGFPSGPGWINVAGLAGVSFFRDLPLQGHILGSSAQPPPPLFLAGGWRTGGDTFFNTAAYDPGHRGFPAGVNVAEYRTSDGEYLPHARQVWFGGIDFDYPVRFNGLTRSFSSPEPKGIDLAILDTQSELEHLTSELADLRFSAHLDLSLLASAEFGVEQGLSWISGHVEDEVVEHIHQGLERLSGLLDARMRVVLDDVLLPVVEASVVSLVDALPENGNGAAITAALDEHLGTVFTERLQGLADSAQAVTNLVSTVEATLGSATDMLTRVREVLLRLDQAEALIRAALEAAGIDLNPATEQALDLALADLEQQVGTEGTEVVGRLVEIRGAISELEQNLALLIDTLEEGQAFLQQLKDTVFTPVFQYAQLAADVKQRLDAWLKQTVQSEPGAYSKAELRARVRQEIRDGFARLPVASALQTVLRSWIYNADAAVRLALDTAFQAINDQVLAVADAALEEIEQQVQPVKTFSSVVESVNWEGRAHIRGDRLSLLRLDNRAIINLPTPVPGLQVPVEFTGFYEFRELTSDGSIGCVIGEPARYHEILLGSSVGPASMLGAGNQLTVASKFTRDGSGALLGLSGGLEMEQVGPEIQVIGVNEFSATLSIGPGLGEFYLSAFCQGRFTAPSPVGLPATVELAGGLLVGRTCTFDSFSWDPLAAEVLGGPVSADNAFTGVYVFGEATVPLLDVGCLLNASIGGGARVFVNDPDFDGANITVGGRLDGEVSGELLCLLRVRGSAYLQGTKTIAPPGPFRFDGGAEVNGKLGICPLCIEAGAEVDAEFVQGGGWSISY